MPRYLLLQPMNKLTEEHERMQSLMNKPRYIVIPFSPVGGTLEAASAEERTTAGASMALRTAPTSSDAHALAIVNEIERLFQLPLNSTPVARAPATMPSHWTWAS